MDARMVAVLTDIVSRIEGDTCSESEDMVARALDEVYSTYYSVKGYEEARRGLMGFVDAGVYVMDLDIACLVYVRIGGLIREPSGELRSVTSLTRSRYPPVERYVILVSRRRSARSGERVYVFDVSLRSPERTSLVLGTPLEAPALNKELNRVLEEVGLRAEYRGVTKFRKLAKYLEGLLELAYAVRMCEEVPGLDYVIVDGTLMRWLSPGKRVKAAGDGLNVLAALTGLSVGELKELLTGKVLGLTKTVSLTTMLRAAKMFKVMDARSSGGLYTLTSPSGVAEAARRLRELKGVLGPGLTRTLVSVFNTKVFQYNELWVARFPLTMDGRHVMVLEAYTGSPVLGGDLTAHPDVAAEVNKVVEDAVLKAFSYRAQVVGQPPKGFMEVDELVRVTAEHRRDFEYAFKLALERAGPIARRVLLQAVEGSFRLRYGYSGGGIVG